MVRVTRQAPPRIDPRRLLDLLAISRHGTFSSAAEALGVSQPGLSQSISVLEHGLGVRVLERGRHGARLTEIGESLAYHANALEGLLDRARRDTEMRKAGKAGPLVVGVSPLTAVSLVPSALQELLREGPHIAVSVVEGLDDALLSMLRARELDIVVSRLRHRAGDLRTAVLRSSGWAVVMRTDNPLAIRKSLSLAELTEAQWIFPSRGSTFRYQLEMMFATAGASWPEDIIESNSILALKAIVMKTGYISIMSPDLVEVERAAGYLKTLPLDDLTELQPIGYTLRGTEAPSPVTARFVEILKATAAA
jgi:DNA-binding transcriptional LysR family regulator